MITDDHSWSTLIKRLHITTTNAHYNAIYVSMCILFTSLNTCTEELRISCFKIGPNMNSEHCNYYHHFTHITRICDFRF